MRRALVGQKKPSAAAEAQIVDLEDDVEDLEDSEATYMKLYKRAVDKFGCGYEASLILFNSLIKEKSGVSDTGRGRLCVRASV